MVQCLNCEELCEVGPACLWESDGMIHLCDWSLIKEMRHILSCNPEQIMRCNTKKSWVGNIWTLRGHTFSNVDFLCIKAVQSDSVGKFLWLVFVFTGGNCAIQVGNTAWFFASMFANMPASDRVNVVGCLAALVGRWWGTNSHFELLQLSFQIYCFMYHLWLPQTIPGNQEKDALFHSVSRVMVFLFLDAVWPSAKVQRGREIFAVVSGATS